MPAPRVPNTEPARLALATKREARRRHRLAETMIDGLAEIGEDPDLDGSDRVALEDARAVLERYAEHP